MKIFSILCVVNVQPEGGGTPIGRVPEAADRGTSPYVCKSRACTAHGCFNPGACSVRNAYGGTDIVSARTITVVKFV